MADVSNGEPDADAAAAAAYADTTNWMDDSTAGWTWLHYYETGSSSDASAASPLPAQFARTAAKQWKPRLAYRRASTWLLLPRVST